MSSHTDNEFSFEEQTIYEHKCYTNNKYDTEYFTWYNDDGSIRCISGRRWCKDKKQKTHSENLIDLWNFIEF